jgi:hypothetical protein
MINQLRLVDEKRYVTIKETKLTENARKSVPYAP